jgi:hypothetical protein
MKRHIEHAWTTATLVAVAALAIALAIAAIFFTRATAQGAALPPSSETLTGFWNPPNFAFNEHLYVELTVIQPSADGRERRG